MKGKVNKSLGLLQHMPWWCMGKWRYSSTTLSHSNRCRSIDSFTLLPCLSWGKSSQYPQCKRLGGPHSWPGSCGEGEQILALLGMKPRLQWKLQKQQQLSDVKWMTTYFFSWLEAFSWISKFLSSCISALRVFTVLTSTDWFTFQWFMLSDATWSQLSKLLNL
jgi:hypothetical protein